jgi:pyruvate dehydrogenase E1 component alpha subunit
VTSTVGRKVQEDRELIALRLLSTDGALLDGAEAPLEDEEVLAAYRLMLTTRRFDERAFSLQRQGRLGTFSQATGQEAAIVGSALALDPARDWVVPQYRELAAVVRQGYSLERFLLYYMGNPAGGLMPDDVRALPFQIALAAQVPHAVGLSWGLRLQGSDAAVIAYFGDGASSEGDVHEAMNFAGVLRAPVVFFLQNNGYAISTPTALQTAAEHFSLRAQGYGFPGELVDGNDLFAVYAATARAIERARAGEGPTLIEAVTYRLGPHNTADDPTRYVDPAERSAAEQADPLVRVRRYLEAMGQLTEAQHEQLEAAAKEEIEAAVTAAEGTPPPGLQQLFDHVYADPPERVRRQRAYLTGEAVRS